MSGSRPKISREAARKIVATLAVALDAKYEYELRAVSEIGLTEVELYSVVTLILGYVHGTGAVEASHAEQRTGMIDEQWWYAHAPLLDKVVDASRYPTATKVGTAAGTSHGAAYN